MRMTESDDSRFRLRARLGLKSHEERSVLPQNPPQVVPEAGSSRKRGNRRPGQRLPKRDPVGNLGLACAS